MEVNWKLGLPETDGLYWFEINNKLLRGTKVNPFILQKFKLETFVYGRAGTMSLSSVYSPKYCPEAKHAIIPMTDYWSFQESVNPPIEFYTWIKSPKDELGVGILRTGTQGFDGDIVWLFSKTHLAECSITIKPSKNYLFQLINLPKV
jgi:hypothetical protein